MPKRAGCWNVLVKVVFAVGAWLNMLGTLLFVPNIGFCYIAPVCVAKVGVVVVF